MLQKDLTIIDNISKNFACAFKNCFDKNEDKDYLKSEHSIYMLVFSLLLTDLEFKNNDNSIKNISNTGDLKNQKFYDLVIYLKNLNDGENFDSGYIKNCFKFAKLIGFINLSNKEVNINKKNLDLYRDGKYKQYE